MITVKFEKIDNSEIVAKTGVEMSQKLGQMMNANHQARGAKSNGVCQNGDVYLVNHMGAIQYAFRNGKIVVQFEPWINDEKRDAVISDFAEIGITAEIASK